ncbi:PREDICTED: midasin isoform X2 [Lupinus angustifolius]|uniref:midasin isoform X2 n=1 Tax=Lupinus angustifolius TaxID=3871 RepID=UPI00092FAA7D|nr:PREDICTED: midasin isoform X2 [Lupinus angustifolius]
MAIDGSFSVQSSLRRFFDRCPKLQFCPEFSSITETEYLLTEDEVVNMLVGVFLHPNYTIPLMGCFRPIAQNFVDKAIALLRLVPNLRSNTKDATLEDDFDRVLEEVVNVIEFYSRQGRGLDLHELACLAFCRAIDMAPFLLSSVLIYFDFAPPPFERFSTKQVAVETRELLVARISYRFLLLDAEVFSKLWDWSCFLDLVKEPLKPDLIWCGVQIVRVVLKLGYRATESLNVGAEEAFACLLHWEEFCRDTSVEKAGWYIEPIAGNGSASPDRSIDFGPENCLKSFGFSNQGVSSPRLHELHSPHRNHRPATRDNISIGNTFVLTSAMKQTYKRVLLAVSHKWPVLLYGPSGSGKSALIAKLAEDSGNRVLSIQMDDQIDGRTLVGSYVCTERPGEFRWQPGSLTQAVQNGFWIVFEDIDKAPSDVHSILVPLLEGAGSFVTGHGEVIRVAESFRVFSTISVSKFDSSQTTGRDSLSVLWRRVRIRPPDDEDLLNILKVRFPNLEVLVDNLKDTFVSVNSVYTLQIVGVHSRSPASVECLNRFSLRDLLKWCNRITGLGFCFNGGISEYHRYVIKEAIDIFATFSTSFENRLSIIEHIATWWQVPVSATENLYPRDKPIIQDSVTDLRIGRVSLPYTRKSSHESRRPFVEIRCSLHVLERIACSVKYNEPVLLVGETGTGKTTLVQNLALRLGQKLTVLNLSQQSDVADLLGGYKPMDAQFVYFPLYKEFEDLFSKTYSKKGNEVFLTHLQKFLIDKNWEMLLRGFQKGVEKSLELIRTGPSKKRRKPLEEEKIQAWERFSIKLESVCQSNPSSGMMFSFVEGSFVTALRNGEWILLDEVNLAPPETLQRIIGVLEGEDGALCLAERGDIDYIRRHPNFRIFACMNPATDAGKRDLPFSLRSRFTEYYVDDVLDDDDLSLFISQFINNGHRDQQLVNNIVRFYKASKKESEERLQDGANQKPQYSLRSLYRALEYTRKAERKFGFKKALYDGFSMFFLTLLDGPSTKIMKQMILSFLLGGHMPQHEPFDRYLTFKSDDNSGCYVLTRSVKEQLGNLARAVLIKRYPVLLQGPTSSGKTSLVQYLAAITGHVFVRINNHEHTDLQEYLGSYTTDGSGKLVFNEGVLVKAVRNGYWIVLDELNLAPSDVLEALNRLLDDNRELFVPELQITIQAHPDFMLFATQNPPTFYGGRKMLSRAFRNRFVEIHVGEIPNDELSEILTNRCEIPESYAKKTVDVMKDLQLHRQSSRAFDGKHGFITPRDLFRWADRYRRFGKSYEDLAKDGYYLLAERLRDVDEKSVVQEVLEKHLRVKLNVKGLYDQILFGGNSSSNLTVGLGGSNSRQSVMLTKSMQRLFFLLERCFKLREPVLLVGETGGGKTTVCQLLSEYLQLKLHILNCHQYTETSDFIGGFRPVRERSRLISSYKEIIEQLKQLKAFTHFPEDFSVSSDIDEASSTLDLLNGLLRKYKGQVCSADVSKEDIHAFEMLKSNLDDLHQKWQSIFVWQDGPLVKAMTDGDLFLVDEISLADDSVLERLNSVLEPERKLSLAEKGGSDLETITAHSNFFVLATMNPGGDYGKKELSPALRNRFTEIWVPPVSDLDELQGIALKRISEFKVGENLDPTYQERLSLVVNAMISFWEWFNQLHQGRMLTVRDLISWLAFFDVTAESLGSEYALLHGIFLVLLDGLSLGTGISKREAEELRERCLSFLLQKMSVDICNVSYSKLSRMGNYGWGEFGTTVDESHIADSQCSDLFGINPFYIQKGFDCCEDNGFEFKAPTTRRNALRVLRAMQLSKPVLLEGSPGVGKTSLIVALGKYSGHRVVRINLSEQTDMMDLLGSDLPVEGDEGMNFSWSDGILLQALREGSWVLLDELNLAPQSVLEGLNAILDHRAEVFIPELGNTYKCPPSFRVFACQNPSCQGGGRKGLPRSFLNRFTKVYVDELVQEDYLSICESKFSSIPRPLLSKLILFNTRMHEDTMLNHKFAKDGFPWEFNLRDIFRSCEIIEGSPKNLGSCSFLNFVYIQRMRTASDRKEVLRLFKEIFEVVPFINPYPRVQLNSHNLVVGNVTIKRNCVQLSTAPSRELLILPEICQSLEAAAQCVERQWLCILVGPSCSGKTSLIRLLANLTGNILNEINLSSASDISELLGCFEQYDALRHLRSVIAQLERYINEYCSLQLEASNEAIIWERDLYTRWIALLSAMKFDSLAASASNYFENWKNVVCSLSLLVDVIEQLKLSIERSSCPISYSVHELDLALKTVLKLKADDPKNMVSKKFEWVTGLLIKAIEQGEWIVLENANLCNPTVLDRINSLVEPHGSITVNERGIVDGHPLVLHPHRNFRMFLTVNPHHGEVSRAMRNRGVEIFMMSPCWALDDIDGYNCEDAELKDVKRFLVLSGIPVAQLVDSMAIAHIYAKKKGSELNAHITYLDLSHWVQLFVQLLMKGCRPIWSLHMSWEHVYLSSLGEVEGENIISFAKAKYLSITDLCGYDSLVVRPLSLPGGWPMPLKLREHIHHSTEASVKRNCMYLKFLGTQFASHQYRFARNRYSKARLQTSGDHARIYLMDMKTLHEIMFPKASNAIITDFESKCEFDSESTIKMLFFAANWAIEQALESDLKFYLIWFRWFSSQLQPFCQFFCNFVTLTEQMVKHPIWEYISCHRKLNFDLQLIPPLSLDFVHLASSNEKIKHLYNAICCIDPLRLTYQQRETESQHNFNDEARCFIPLLKSLHVLEDEFLNKLVASTPKLIEDQSFDFKIQLYSDLIADHALFWHYFISSKFDEMIISWHSLVKDAGKFIDICPQAVDDFLMESKNLKRFSLSEKSLLWIHGGHPFLSPSSDIHDKQDQLLRFVEMLWPRKTASSNQGLLSSHHADVALFDSNLRFLVMQGVSMSSFTMEKWGNEYDDVHIVKQLEEMYQTLLRCFEEEKNKLMMNTGSEDLSAFRESSSCCLFTCEMLCQKSVFEGWQDTLPPVDNTSLFWDMELLQELTTIPLDNPIELHHAVEHLSNLLDSALKFSLSFSSRTPQMFSPHQKILWTLNAWTTVDAVNLKISSFILEMWFIWHQSLWESFPRFNMDFSKMEGFDIVSVALPQMLTQPVCASTVLQNTKSTHAIKEFWVQGLKFRATLSNLWQSSRRGVQLPSFLLSTARSLFQQIVFAHRKSFDAAQFTTIKLTFSSFEKNIVTEQNIHLMSTLISSSSHHRLKNSINEFIIPLLKELYHLSSTADFNYVIGRAWVHIGQLRIHLLLSCNDIDPAMKYHCKYSQLVETISSLELEIQVRKECGYLAGQFFIGEADNRKAERLEKLQAERRKLQKKIVFRSEPWKFKRLMNECNEFLKHVAALEVLISSIEAEEFQLVLNKACSWQETATCFIDGLTAEFTAYNDIIQPIQVAVYEMKLGLSLVLSSKLEKEYLNKIGQENISLVMEMLHTLMRFPRAASSKFISVKYDIGLHMRPSYELDSDTGFYLVDMGLMQRLINLSTGIAADKKVSVMQYKAAIYRNILVQIAHSIANAKLIDNESYKLLHTIFDEFANLWMSMKVYAKSKSEYDAQQYKFKPRAFQVESVIDVEIETLANSSATETFSEWKEFSSEEKSADKIESSEECENLDEEWKQLEESILSNVVFVHNQLFGSGDLVQIPGTFQVSDADRMLSFIDTYTLGTDLIKGVHTSMLPKLDAKLMPEHLFYLCLDYKRKFLSSHKTVTRYNFYKDSNAPEMANMLNVLTPIQKEILPLLNEWADHNDLQKILDIIDMLLSLPSGIPLAKAFSGLQFLLHKAQIMQESGSKFSLSNQFKSVFDLLSSWQKMEIGSWPTLLDEVLDQFENNAAKLWFPLYSVLQPSESSVQSIVQSLEDFIHTSSVGEFRKRLQLIFAFLGQNHISTCLKINSSPCWMEQSTFLYNIFGFYVQFLPFVLKYIDDSRKEIDTELKALVKLCRWEHGKSYLSLDNLKKSRQKLKKLIQKFTDILEEPVLIFLKQEAAHNGAKSQLFHGHKLSYNVLNKGSVNGAFDLMLFSEENRSAWFENCSKKLECALHKFFNVLSSHGDNVKDVLGISIPCGDSVHELNVKGWEAVWHMIEQIYFTAVDCGDLWKEEKKSRGKRRALAELLKLLESSGLSRHKSTYKENIQEQIKTWWFLQLSENMEHLLPSSNKLACVTSEIDAVVEHKDDPEENLLVEWKTGTEHYFKSVVSVRHLQDICDNPHKDITLEQVDRSRSFINQLVEIQQKQLAAASVFDKQLKCLRNCVSTLGKCSSADDNTIYSCSIIPKQLSTYKCMWQQKQLFDNLCAISHEELLLLRTLENSHLNTCQKTRPSVSEMIASIEEFLPVFCKSKESLDQYLVGRTKAVTAVGSSSQLCFVTQEMEQLVCENFKAIKDFKEHFLAQWERDQARSTAKEVLILHFEEIIETAKLIEKEFTTSNSNSVDSYGEDRFCTQNLAELNAGFDEALTSTYQHISTVLQNLILSSNIPMVEDSVVNIASWEFIFDSIVTIVSVDKLCENVYKTIASGEKLANHCGTEINSYSLKVGACFRDLHMFMDLFLNFGDELMKSFLTMHRSVSLTTHVIANILASLFSKGFGISNENEENDGTVDTSEDANGTGMGEGVGLKDVSDQITDEDQLLGTRDQPNDKEDDSKEVPSSNTTGIEMEQDFAADAVSLSEDSGEDEDEDVDGENNELDSEMGPTGPDSEAVDEKVWDKNEDETPNNDTKENSEPGPSVKDKDGSKKELRAKDDSATDEPGGDNGDEGDAQNDDIETQDDIGDEENETELNMDKEADHSDPNGLNPDELEQKSEVEDPMEVEDMDPVEDPEEQGDPAENGNDNQDEETYPTDENMEEAHTELDQTSEKDEQCPDQQDNADMNSTEPKKDTSEPSNLVNEQVSSAELASQSKVDQQTSGPENMASESNWSNNDHDIDNPSLLGGFPSTGMSDMDVKMSDSSNTGGFEESLPKSHPPQDEHSSFQENKPNPYRSLGDALEYWKEKIRVSGDIEGDDIDEKDKMEDDNADEYGYVSEFEKGTDQALGPASSEQVDKNIDADKLDKDSHAGEKDVQLQFEKKKPEVDSVNSSSLIPKNEKKDQLNASAIEKSQDEESVKPITMENNDPENQPKDLISFRRSYISENIDRLNELSVEDNDLGKSHDPSDDPNHMKDNATALWRKYELSTTKLSLELAEQLRLVMQPTVASKLQGDYRTGKRINMKKVIAYIASHYRKDKIWLRRTRPNKRDYQVVIAIDDSHSMSESCCGDVAVEAMITVCRAISQLEMGSLAVASFGTKGNIKLLHDFDRPFTGEAGVKMISNLTFKQENTIADEPVVDLLKFLTNKLDSAVVKARLPSGRSPLQQLVLIIADGRFHEKENLKRYVRDVSTGNRMVAFLLLDNSQESIMDLMEASFEGGNMKFSKYMDSFPFPYYIILRNIEALPRTLANLLRQWMELMQNSMDY